MKRSLYLAIVIITALACGLPDAGAATIYRWTDSNGTVHFGERPPQGVDAQPVGVEQAPVDEGNADSDDVAVADTAAAAAPATEPTVSLAQQRRDERAEKLAARQENQAALQTRCEAMREQLAYSEPSPRVIVKDDNGVVRRLSDTERLELLNEARTFLNNNDCD